MGDPTLNHVAAARGRGATVLAGGPIDKFALGESNGLADPTPLVLNQ